MSPAAPRRRALLSLTALALVLPLTACELANASFRAEEQEEWKRSFTISPTGRFEIENTNGAVEVEATTGAEVQVRALRIAKAATPEAAKDLLKRVEIEVVESPDQVKLKTKTPRGMNLGGTEVRYFVKVPKALAVKLENTNGRISIAGLASTVEADTTNGGIVGTGLTGPVRASTTNGGVDVEVAAVHDGGIELSTTNGGVSLKLPSSAKADLTASCTNGGISTEGLTLEARESSRRRVDGRLNGGGPKIRLETTNGGVRVAGR